MRICLIGCGYVGKALALYWNNTHHLTVTTRSPRRIAELEPLCRRVHLLDGNFSELLRHQEAVVIAVAPDQRSIEAYRETYVETAQKIKQAAPDTPLIYLSSTSVYGDKGGRWIDETEPPAPATPQARLLLEAEQILQGPQTCILRLGEIYGPGREFTSRLKTKEPFPGTGSNYVNIIHRDKIVAAIDLALNKNLKGVFNLSEALSLTRKEFYDALCEKENLPKVTWDPARASIHSGNKRIKSQFTYFSV